MDEILEFLIQHTGNFSGLLTNKQFWIAAVVIFILGYKTYKIIHSSTIKAWEAVSKELDLKNERLKNGENKNSLHESISDDLREILIKLNKMKGFSNEDITNLGKERPYENEEYYEGLPHILRTLGLIDLSSTTDTGTNQRISNYELTKKAKDLVAESK